MSAVLPAPGEVHVWQFTLDVDADTQARLARLLDEDERRRADRFRFDQHRRRFIVRRGALRLILARHAGTAPQAIRYAGGAASKPHIAAPEQACALRFSASSSQELGAVALARDRELGLDVEEVRPDRDHELITRQLAGEEAAALQRLEPTARIAAFFDLWTCKEAYLKAKGSGLNAPLDCFAVDAGSATPRLMWSALERGGPPCWSLRRLALRPGFASCVAVSGECDRIFCEAFAWEGGARRNINR